MRPSINFYRLCIKAICTHAQARSQGRGREAMPPLNPSAPPQLEEEIVQWPCPLINRLSGLLRKIELFMGCSVGFKYAKYFGGRGSTPNPTGGAHDVPPYLLLRSGWKGGGQGAMPPKQWTKKIKTQLPHYAYRRAGSRCH